MSDLTKTTVGGEDVHQISISKKAVDLALSVAQQFNLAGGKTTISAAVGAALTEAFAHFCEDSPTVMKYGAGEATPDNAIHTKSPDATHTFVISQKTAEFAKAAAQAHDFTASDTAFIALTCYKADKARQMTAKK